MDESHMNLNGKVKEDEIRFSIWTPWLVVFQNSMDNMGG